MKTRLLSLCAILGAFLLGGCATTGTPVISAPAAGAISEFVVPLVQGAVPLVLDKNPGYADAIDTLAGSLTVAFGTGDITPAAVGGALAALNAKAHLQLDVSTETYLASAIAVAVQTYKQHYGITVANATDPGVQLLLTALAGALHDGTATWRSVHQAALAGPTI